jgi:hypothetical protein
MQGATLALASQVMMATVSISPPSELIEMTSARIYRDALSARIDQGRLGIGIVHEGRQ